MRTLYLQKVSKEKLCKEWKIKGTLIKDDEELFVRSNKKGRVNWDKTVLYFWADVIDVKNRRNVKFTLPPYPEYLSED